MELASANPDNRLDFLPQRSFLPFEWRNLGQAYASSSSDPSPSNQLAAAKLSGRATFVVRQGYDPLDNSSTGRVLEGDGDLGIAFRLKSLAFGLTASNLAMRSGLDDPLTEAAAAVSTAPSLKATIAQEFSEDCFLAASYDLKLRKPELALCLAGETFTERATLCLQADPIQRALKIAAAVAFPGPEWRDTLYDEEKDAIEYPRDDGGRHRLWLRHEARPRALLHHTSVGASIDLGRTINWVCSQVDYKLEPRIPPLFWALPLSHTLYNALVPAEDENQVHHKISGWDLEVSHDFARSAPRLALIKTLRHASLSASWDMHSREAGVEYGRRGLRLGAKLGKVEGLGWKQPSLYLHVEPLALL